MATGRLSLAVVIASYRRDTDLARCLDGLAALVEPADDVVVVARDDDPGTARVVEAAAARHGASLPARAVSVTRPGTVAARNAGIDAVGADLVAFIDDDTVVAPDWAGRIRAHFAADPDLGALGGRDRCHDGERFDDREAAPVGRVQWFGRLVGNHHLGHGAPREAEWLKGANMIFRRRAIDAIRFSDALRGSKAQPAEDVAFSLAVTRSGWRTLYDPAVTLDHYAAKRDEVRHYVGGRTLADPAGYYDFCFNSVVAVWPYLSPARRAAHAAWSVAVGISLRPGLVQLARLWPSQRGTAIRRFRIAQRAHWDASHLMLRLRERRPVAEAGSARGRSGIDAVGVGQGAR